MRYLVNIIFAIASGVLFVDIITHMVAGRYFDESALFTVMYGFEGVNFAGFYKQISYTLIGVLATLLIAFHLHKTPILGKIVHKYSILSISLCVGFVLTSNPVRTIGSAYFGLTAPSFNLNKNDIKFDVINDAPRIYSKNIVYLYLESFEKAYLDERQYPGLAPNLAKLSQGADRYTNIYGLVSAAWTMGGKVASQCGIPLITPLGTGNNMAKIDAFLPAALCIGDVLSRAGYNLEYFGGAKKEFAGKNKLYGKHGFSSVKGLDELVRPGENSWSWGRSDEKTLLDVYERYDELQRHKQPFGIYSLTLDTHGPDGHVPDVCKGLKYGDGSNPMLNAVHCNDLIVSEFIRKVRSHPDFENTVLVVASDHPLGGDLYDNDRRNLFLVFTDTSAPKQYARGGTPFDVGPTVLGYLSDKKIKGFGLGRDLRNSQVKTLAEVAQGPENVDQFVAANRDAFAGYWNFPSTISEGIKIADDDSVIIGDQRFTLPVVLELHGSEITGIVLEELAGISDTVQHFATAVQERNEAFFIEKCTNLQPYLDNTAGWSDLCVVTTNNKAELNLYGIESGHTYYKDDFSPVHGLASVPTSLKSLDAILRYKSIPDFINYVGDIRDVQYDITSVGLNSGASSRVRIGEKVLDSSLRRGLNIIRYSNANDASLIDVIDTCIAKVNPDEKKIADYFQVRRPGEKIFIVAYDSAFCNDPERLSDVFEGSGLEKGMMIGFRQPYIALVSDELKVEYLGSISFPLIVTNDTSVKGYAAKADLQAHTAQLPN